MVVDRMGQPASGPYCYALPLPFLLENQLKTPSDLHAVHRLLMLEELGCEVGQDMGHSALSLPKSLSTRSSPTVCWSPTAAQAGGKKVNSLLCM